MIKAVFFDIDGTLVSFNTHSIPASSIKAIERLRGLGIKVFICTGRPFVSIDNLGTLEFDGYISANGGYCLGGDKQVIYKNHIPHKDIKTLIEYQKGGTSFPCLVSLEDEVFITDKNDSTKQVIELVNFSDPPVRDLEYASSREIFQMMAFLEPDREAKVMETVLPGCEMARWHPLFADVVAKGNNKRTGMDKMLELHNILPGEVMAFGDGDNDIPMLTYAAIGVAMGNANGKVKACASYVTDSVDNDGIWNALLHFKVI